MSNPPKRKRSDAYQRIYAVVRKIPHGKIASYGQVAELAGLSGHARQVGYALHATPDDADIPWQRVVNAKGEISPRSEPFMEGVQQSLLEAEGVSIDGRGRIDLARFRWQPRLHLFTPEDPGAKSQEGKQTMSMIKLAIDFDCPSPSWWDDGGRDLWESILEGFDNNDVLLDKSIAESWLSTAAAVPGWDDGPEHAPHPIRLKEIDEDEFL
ncbi:MAG: MGMT family protein [Myxococcales bacterium]|nr:MGMT family protein [Myxococcales bacterium]